MEITARMQELTLSLCKQGLPLSEVSSICEVSNEEIYQIIASHTQLSIREVRVVSNLLSRDYTRSRISKEFSIDQNTLDKFLPAIPDSLLLFVTISDGRSTSVNALPSDTVENLRTQIQDKVDSPTDEGVLVFGGQFLDEDRTLSDCGISNESVVDLLLNAKIC
jgi:hypothetical protein